MAWLFLHIKTKYQRSLRAMQKCMALFVCNFSREEENHEETVYLTAYEWKK